MKNNMTKKEGKAGFCVILLLQKFGSLSYLIFAQNEKKSASHANFKGKQKWKLEKSNIWRS